MNRARPELVLCFLLGIAAFAFWESTLSFHAANCTYQDQYKRQAAPDDRRTAAKEQGQNRDKEHGNKTVAEPFVCTVAGIPTSIRVFMNLNEGFFVGGFTLLLVFVTAWLVWATIKLWQGAENTAQRQLQAYISMSPNQFGGLFNGYVRITFDVKNSGTTPAFDIHHFVKMAVIPNPLPAGFEFPEPDMAVPIQTTLAPGGNLETRFFVHIEDLPWHLGEIAANRERVHCWGTAHYRDVFDIARHTTFSASAGGPDFVAGQIAFSEGEVGPGWQWDYGPNHNRIT